MISFSEIFKQALAILRAHKVLWALGLFLFWDLVANVVSYVYNQNQSLLTIAPKIGTVVIIAIAGIIILQLSFRARAGIIWSVKEILEQRHVIFGKLWNASRKYYRRLFGIWFATFFLLIAAAVILVVPIAYLVSIGLTQRASALGILALIIFVPLFLISNFVNNLAPMYVVIYDMNFKPAVAASFDMIRKFWLLLLWFSVVLGIMTFFVSYLLVGLGGKGVVFFLEIFYNTAGIHATVSSVLLGICALAAFLFFASFLASFQQICWTLLFTKLTQPVKTPEEEVAPVPEVIN